MPAPVNPSNTRGVQGGINHMGPPRVIQIERMCGSYNDNIVCYKVL